MGKKRKTEVLLKTRNEEWQESVDDYLKGVDDVYVRDVQRVSFSRTIKDS